MAQPLLPDALWERIEPLFPPTKPRRFRFPGRKPLTNRQALTGILFVLRTGIRWNDLPCEMGCGSGSACRKRLQLWQELGIWDQLHHLLLEELQQADKIDWSRAAVDSSFARALGGGEDTGPNPTDRGKKGRKHHVVVDAQGIPLSATATWRTTSAGVAASIDTRTATKPSRVNLTALPTRFVMIWPRRPPSPIRRSGSAGEIS